MRALIYYRLMAGAEKDRGYTGRREKKKKTATERQEERACDRRVRGKWMDGRKQEDSDKE